MPLRAPRVRTSPWSRRHLAFCMSSGLRTHRRRAEYRGALSLRVVHLPSTLGNEHRLRLPNMPNHPPPKTSSIESRISSQSSPRKEQPEGLGLAPIRSAVFGPLGPCGIQRFAQLSPPFSYPQDGLLGPPDDAQEIYRRHPGPSARPGPPHHGVSPVPIHPKPGYPRLTTSPRKGKAGCRGVTRIVSPPQVDPAPPSVPH